MISQTHNTQFMRTILLSIVCILLILGSEIASYHHHEDGTSHETCSLCILINNFSGFFISEQLSLIQPTDFYTLIGYYPVSYSNHTHSFYHSRSPPF